MKYTQNIRKAALATAISLTLTACGGGGGGGGSSKPQPRTFTINTAEGETVTKAVSGTVSDLKQIKGSSSITASGSGSTLTFTVAQLENNAEARFSVTTKQGDNKTESIYSVIAENTSARDVLAEIESLQKMTHPRDVLADDFQIANIALEVEYLSNQIDSAAQDSLRNLIDAETKERAKELSRVVQATINLSDRYYKNEVTETDLRNNRPTLARVIADYGAAGEAVLDDQAVTLRQLNINLPDDLNANHPIVFDETFNRFTRYVAPEFGEMNSNGTFTFREEYSFLNAAFEFAQPAPADDQSTASNAGQ